MPMAADRTVNIVVRYAGNKGYLLVIPAEAGTHILYGRCAIARPATMDSRLRGNDDAGDSRLRGNDDAGYGVHNRLA